MTEESYSFTTARARLEEIVTQVRKKDTSLEKSLDLLEEGVRLANQCTELIDHADWEAAAGRPATPEETSDAAEGEAGELGERAGGPEGADDAKAGTGDAVAKEGDNGDEEAEQV